LKLGVAEKNGTGKGNRERQTHKDTQENSGTPTHRRKTEERAKQRRDVR